MKQVAARVISNSMVCPGVFLIKLQAPEISAPARPGQFVMVKCGTGLMLRRPLSIHRTTGDGTLSLLFTVTGKGTSWLSQQKTDDTVDVIGPMGNGFSLLPDSHRILLIAGGIGITPLTFLALEALSHNKAVTLLQGAVTASALFTDMNLPEKAQTVYTTDDGSLGYKGTVTDMLADYIPRADHIYACGPLPMYRTLAQTVNKLTVNTPVDISLEVRMGCGIGTCYGCSIRTRQGMKRVCRDGPVFNLHDIIWEEIRL